MPRRSSSGTNPHPAVGRRGLACSIPRSRDRRNDGYVPQARSRESIARQRSGVEVSLASWHALLGSFDVSVSRFNHRVPACEVHPETLEASRVLYAHATRPHRMARGAATRPRSRWGYPGTRAGLQARALSTSHRGGLLSSQASCIINWDKLICVHGERTMITFGCPLPISSLPVHAGTAEPVRVSPPEVGLPHWNYLSNHTVSNRTTS